MKKGKPSSRYEAVVRDVLEGPCAARCTDDQRDINATVKALVKALEKTDEDYYRMMKVIKTT